MAIDGETGDTSHTITIRNVAPTIINVLALPNVGDEPLTSTVTATDAVGDVGDLLYSFDCNGDDIFEVPPQAANSADCTFPDGTKTVAVNVKVDDRDGGVTTGSVPVTVLNVAPNIISILADPVQLPSAGGPSTITINATDVATADRPGLIYSFDCNNDGTFEAGPQAGNSTICAFTGADQGQNTVIVNVTDKDGGVSTGGTTVDVGPVAVIAAPTSWDEGSATTFDARGSKPGVASPPVPIINYRWDFGDSTIVSGPGAVVGHAFHDDGIYIVRLVVTDGAGDTADATNTIAIRNVAPTITAPAASPRLFLREAKAPSPSTPPTPLVPTTRCSSPSTGMATAASLIQGTSPT